VRRERVGGVPRSRGVLLTFTFPSPGAVDRVRVSGRGSARVAVGRLSASTGARRVLRVAGERRAPTEHGHAAALPAPHHWWVPSRSSSGSVPVEEEAMGGVLP
jgi:hypothetical protein